MTRYSRFSIVSLKFAPGLKKEFFVLGENLKRAGFDVKYLIACQYQKLGIDANNVAYLPIESGVPGMIRSTINFFIDKELRKNFDDHTPSIYLFYNPHPLNPVIARMIKKNAPASKLILYLHDPYKPEKAAYGFVKSIYIYIVELIQRLTVKYTDYVISPSSYSAFLFNEYYREFSGKNYIVPLLIPDQRLSTSKQRRYFTMVGTAHHATGHGLFINLVNYAAARGLDFEFALISSSNITQFLKKLTADGARIIKVINKAIITDEEINGLIRESFAVFRLDDEVTQSGVIPVSYMNGTPLIVRDIPGLTQHVKHGESGVVIPFNATPAEIVNAMIYVQDNLERLSANSRESYEETWAAWNFKKYYGWIENIK